MKHVLDPLVQVPGVRVAMLVTPDGVPIAVQGDRRAPRDPNAGAESRGSNDAKSSNTVHTLDYEGPDRRKGDRGMGAGEDVLAWAALGAGWIGEVGRAVAPLSWTAPDRLVLQAARGTMIVMQAPGALLLVVLRNGTRAEELRVPMEAAVGRIERHLRAIGAKSAPQSDVDSMPSILPARSEPREAGDVPAGGENWVSTSGNVNPEVSGE